MQTFLERKISIGEDRHLKPNTNVEEKQIYMLLQVYNFQAIFYWVSHSVQKKLIVSNYRNYKENFP